MQPGGCVLMDVVAAWALVVGTRSGLRCGACSAGCTGIALRPRAPEQHVQHCTGPRQQHQVGRVHLHALCARVCVCVGRAEAQALFVCVCVCCRASPHPHPHDCSLHQVRHGGPRVGRAAVGSWVVQHGGRRGRHLGQAGLRTTCSRGVPQCDARPQLLRTRSQCTHAHMHGARGRQCTRRR